MLDPRLNDINKILVSVQVEVLMEVEYKERTEMKRNV